MTVLDMATLLGSESAAGVREVRKSCLRAFLARELATSYTSMADRAHFYREARSKPCRVGSSGPF